MTTEPVTAQELLAELFEEWQCVRMELDAIGPLDPVTESRIALNCELSQRFLHGNVEFDDAPAREIAAQWEGEVKQLLSQIRKNQVTRALGFSLYGRAKGDYSATVRRLYRDVEGHLMSMGNNLLPRTVVLYADRL